MTMKTFKRFDLPKVVCEGCLIVGLSLVAWCIIFGIHGKARFIGLLLSVIGVVMAFLLGGEH